MYKQIRKRVWQIVEVAEKGDTTSRAFDIFILTLIFLNVIAVIVETIKPVQILYGDFLNAFEVFSVIIFTIEYVARIWSCTEKYSSSKLSRIRYMFTPMAIIDLLAILPFYISLEMDLRAIRILRLFRIFRVAKVGRYYSSLQLIKDVVKKKKEELVLSLVIMLFLLIVSSSVIYYVENSAQPEVFSSIPSAMWWAIVTLSTVGYGEIYPITVLGKFVAAIIAILGIGMFALPTGILGAGFVEELQLKKSGQDKKKCPHCGKDIEVL